MKFTRRLTVFFVALISLFTLHVQAQEVQNPYVMLEEIADTMVARIGNERAQIEANPNYLRTIMEEELLPHSDYQFAARMVLGRNWQRLNDTQKEQFVQAFRDYLVTTYARVFTQYDEAKHTLEFGREEPYQNERRVVVRAQLIEAGGRPPVRLDFHLQRRTPTSPWLAFDLVAEGISMLNAQQSEMQASLRQRGIDGTIKLLQDRAKVDIDLNEEVSLDDFKN
ncbi:organic solvent ABC transporter [Aliidiomarina taiwanensis]|uniref:Organic solvent ABC transporter n=1 Tax=Aliidiomarina taiwanensis TaxID=946228 RepID=A0A432X0V0_9GAMM|nr:ABC transporter substrate-binding protein [Aliidiomarina taiwanensis]RUO39785.1 organic solvent ABC transporter [Aliidiomarina taiwanensis]